MGSLSFLVLLVLLCINLTNAQNYIPKPPPMTTCPAGYTFVRYGDNDVASLGTFAATTTSLANYIMTTLFNATQAGVIVSQLSFGITDNTNIASVVQLRLAIFKVTKEDTANPQSVLLSQTEEINLYATAPDVIYGNLMQNVTLQPGLYAIGVWSNVAIRTGVAPVQAGAIKNVPYQYYSSAGIPPNLQPNGYTYGFRALQAHGCLPASNPYTDPNNQVINFCAYLQTVNPPATATSYQYQYAAQTITYTLGGQLAVSNIDTGTSSNGVRWGRVVAGFATMTTQSTSDWYYQQITTLTDSVIIGSGVSNQFDQQLYLDINAPRVDAQGISFTSASGVQLVISHSNGTYQITRYRGGSYTRFSAVLSGFTTTSGSTTPACVPPTDYVPDTMMCEAGALTMNYGDPDPDNARFLYNTPSSAIYANFLYTRTFTAWDADVQLKQLSLYMIDNLGVIVKIRMGVFEYEPGSQYPTLTLVSQTREVLLKNVVRGNVKINLINEINLEQGKNYTIGFMTDQPIYAAYAYWIYTPVYFGLPYDRFMGQNGFPQTIATQSSSYITAMGATGCKRQTTTRQYGFCAYFVYPTYSTTYSGVLDVIATPSTSDLGTYYRIVDARGTYNQTYTTGSTAPRIFPFRYNNYNHPVNYRLYTAPTSARRYADSNGWAFIVQALSGTTNQGFAGQISTFWDPVSASWEYIERQQIMSNSWVTTTSNLISDMEIREGGAEFPCNPPPRPVNSVSPASVARYVCPNNGNTISEVFGDASVGDFEVNADGTIIEANKIYTHSFVATSTATVQQIAIGVLRNTDRYYQINARLGLYAAATNTLLVQANQLTLNQAVDQLIVMNLPSVVTVTAGQTYYIALVVDQPLEVATGSVPNSPSMAFTFSTNGLPTTFVPGPNAPSVSIAVYTCVSSTHSFCAYYQYYNANERTTLTYLYQGLMQVEGQATDAYGTYKTIYAASGRLLQYSRTSTSTSSGVSLFTFNQQPDDEARLYISSTNNQPLNGQGIRLAMSTGTESVINYNISNQMMDESFQPTNLDVNLRFSDFRYSALSSDSPLPACGISNIPTRTPPAIPDVTCPSDQTMVVHGSARVEDLEYPRETWAVNTNTVVFNTFTTGAQATMVHQLKHGFILNRNLINRIRLGLYTSNFTYLGSTGTIPLENPEGGIVTAALASAVYLAPNTVYWIGVWSENAMSTGYGSSYATSFTIPFSGPWPSTFDLSAGQQYNNERALAAVGCSTPTIRPVDPPSSTAGPQPGVSSTENVRSSSSSTAAPSQPSSSSPSSPPSSTGDSVQPPAQVSTSSDGLSKGAVAGAVLGTVIGANCLLLAVFWLCCMSGARAGGKALNSSKYESEQSRVSEPSKIEMGEVSTAPQAQEE